MSGARLEMAGQVRNAYPYLINEALRVRLTIPVATFGVSEQPLRINRTQIPYDLGPDKADRVFLTINGVNLIVSADAGITSALNGFLFYRGADARKVYLASVAQVITAPYSISTVLQASPAMAITAESVDNIGYIGFENNASVAGGAANIIVEVGLNIGLYATYGEPNWNELFKSSMHEHIGLSIYREENENNGI